MRRSAHHVAVTETEFGHTVDEDGVVLAGDCQEVGGPQWSAAQLLKLEARGATRGERHGDLTPEHLEDGGGCGRRCRRHRCSPARIDCCVRLAPEG